jgi:predicted nucleic acid-binding protein
MSAAAIVVDTSAWIEWLIASKTAASFETAFPERDACIVPTIVQLELAKWLTRELGEEKSDQVIAYTQKCHVIAMDTSIALLAAELCPRYKLATADSIVYATCLNSAANLLTCDAHFKDLPNVKYFGKVE